MDYLYYEKGLTPLNPNDANTWIWSFFGKKFPDLKEEIITQSINEMMQELNVRENRIYFVLDDQFLIIECGHYLLYGSEYILGVFATIESKTRESYREYLMVVGQPTIFVCDIPFDLLSDSTKLELAQLMIRKTCKEQYNSYEHNHTDFGFMIRNILPPDRVVKHFHPQDISSPL